MSGLRQTIGSTIGVKTVMALTGLALFLFVVGHLVGTLQIFVGREAINNYAELLQSSGPVLWGVRSVMLVLLLAHVVSALVTWNRSRAARPVPYKMVTPQKSTYASRTMLLTGLILLAYVLFHLLHFTVGAIQPAASQITEVVGEAERKDVYGMMIAGFSNAWVVLIYVVSMGLLALHLSHGVSSSFQTLGVTHPRLVWLKGSFGGFVAIVIFLGYVLIPLSVLLGLVE
ncbi:MAG: succinate dehydrogenase cytochrome b subunit [Planctomycetota bacterium]